MPEPIPPPAAPSVIVRPIQPHQSRTIREAWLWQIWTVIVAAAPDFIGILVGLLTTDKQFYEAVSRWLPWPVRYIAMTTLITYAQRNIRLRKTTVAPIAGTEAARDALPLTARRES